MKARQVRVQFTNPDQGEPEVDEFEAECYWARWQEAQELRGKFVIDLGMWPDPLYDTDALDEPSLKILDEDGNPKEGATRKDEIFPESQPRLWLGLDLDELGVQSGLSRRRK